MPIIINTRPFRQLFNANELLPKPGKCTLFNYFSYITQLSLVLISFSVLICIICIYNTLIGKRYRETPRREWKIWFLDVSKQVCSVGLEHIVNLGISVYLSSKTSADECIWYFINCFVDATIGVCLCVIMMTIINKLVIKCKCILLRSGLYYDIITDNHSISYSINTKMYFAQLFLWLGVMLVSQGVLLALNILCKQWFEVIGNFLLKPFLFNEKIELIMIMIVFPLIFNTIQFWLFDNLLKLNNENSNNNSSGNDLNTLVENNRKIMKIELVESPKETKEEGTEFQSNKEKSNDNENTTNISIDNLKEESINHKVSHNVKFIDNKAD